MMRGAAVVCIAPRSDAPRSFPLSTQIRAPHESEFFLNVVEEPVVWFERLLGHLFHLGRGVDMQFQVDALPTLLAQGDEALDRAALLLPTGISESFCDRALGEIKQVGKTERHEVGGKASEISDTITENLFHFGRDIDRVACCFHRS